MSEKIRKEINELKISLGLLVGYLIGGLVNMLVFDKPWQEAYSDKEIIVGLAGIGLSLFIILRLRRRNRKAENS